jgi:phosphatidylglycerol:prolipoprotein diacylglycerol transferase
MIFSCSSVRLCKIGIDPIAFTLGSGPNALRIHWYGIFIAIGLFVGIQVALRDSLRKGVSPDALMSAALWCAILGVAGGRLYYVVQNDFLDYLKHPQNIIAVWQGGMAFYGAIFGGALAIALYGLLTHVSVWKLFDVGALGLAMGQGIGRIGNIINGDVIGYPTDGSWGVIYTHPNALAPLNRAVQPAAFYELVFSFLLFALLWSLRKRVQPDGMLAMLYLVLYSLGQLVIFVFRDNVVLYYGLKQAQLTALVVIALTLPVMAFLATRARRQPAAEAVAAEPPVDVATASPSAPAPPDA